MARRRLIEYLNDPSLLHSISIDELRAWVEQAPYAGLIQKLLVQKLILNKASADELKKATTLAILSNANPDVVIKSIDDFKKWMLSKESNTIEGVKNLRPDFSDGYGVSDVESNEEDHDKTNKVVEDHLREEETTREQDQVILPDGESIQLTSEEDITIDTDSEDLSDFGVWLTTLKPLRSSKKSEHRNLELENKQLASAALAELLVEQGHYNRAIEMYKLLMMKNPQKSSFFAAQIEKLKTL